MPAFLKTLPASRALLGLVLSAALTAGCHDDAPGKLVAQAAASPSPVASDDAGSGDDTFADIQPDDTQDDQTQVAVNPDDTPDASAPATPQPAGRTAVLPNGRKVVPAGKTLLVGNLPFDCALSPDGHWLAVLHGGEHAHGVDLLDTSQSRIVQTYDLKDSFRGLAWSPDGQKLFVSGSSDKFVDMLRLQSGKLVEGLSSPPVGHAAGITVASDGTPFVVDDTTDRLHRLSATGQSNTYFAVGKTPFAVATDASGNAYVACWGSHELTIVDSTSGIAHVPVGSHPSAIALRPGKPEAWVANTNDDTLSVVDTQTRKVTRTLGVPAYPGAPEGSGPTSLAWSPDGSRLYVALAGANAIAVVDPASGHELGRIPTAWYPSSLAVAPDGSQLYVACAKGFGQGPRKNAPVWKMKGAVQIVPTPDDATLASLTQKSDVANRFGAIAKPAWLPPIKHVVYVLRENRTYDQELGDLARGEGDPSLCIYGWDVTPNTHSLAEHFAFGDHFYCDGEVSAQGHQWAQGANCSDAVERLYPAVYAKQGRWADSSQRTLLYPDTDYLIERCVRKHVSVRVYGESLRKDRDVSLKGIRSTSFKGWDLQYPDLQREAAWEAEFKQGIFPAFSHVWFMRDHTLGPIPFGLTPRSLVADNDAATGKLVDALSHDPRWKDTLVIIQEDDAQGGYDHVDGHRSVLVLASPWIKPGTVTSKHYSQASLVATVDALLGLGNLSQYDAQAPIIDDIWTQTPDMRPFNAITAKVSLNERNPANGPLAHAFTLADFEGPDEGDQALLARALWLDAHARRK